MFGPVGSERGDFDPPPPGGSIRFFFACLAKQKGSGELSFLMQLPCKPAWIGCLIFQNLYTMPIPAREFQRLCGEYPW